MEDHGAPARADDVIDEAPAEKLPAVLVDPPWVRAELEHKAALRAADQEPIIIAGLQPPADVHIVWADGERAAWAVAYTTQPTTGTWEDAAGSYLDGRLSTAEQTYLFAKGPEELVLPLLSASPPYGPWFHAAVIKPIVERFECAAFEPALRAAKNHSFDCGPVMVPFLGVEVARLMADWLVRLKSVQRIVRQWFGRHGLTAVPYLVPDALGKRKVARRNAMGALALLAEEHGREQVVAAAERSHGDAAAQALDLALASGRAVTPDPSARRQIPAVPWADPAALPRPVLRDGGAVPAEAARHIITMFAMSGMAPYPGLQEVLRACTPESVSAFGWGVFEAWRAAGQPSPSSWVIGQLKWTGNDDTAQRLTPVIRAWPGQSGHQKAVMGLQVLTAIGTDSALMQLNGIAQNVRYNGLKSAAARQLAQLAKDRGLTPGQLADRLVPGFGLDADGGLTLDYGPRRFVVGFDEELKPYVKDANDGKRRKDLPKPGVKDDAELSAAARLRFSALKKGVRTVASDQVRRLEAAMLTGRTWAPEEFDRFIVRHPLMRHIARRLLWACEPGDAPGAPRAAADGSVAAPIPFRVAEDLTFTDVNDDAFTLAGDARIGIVHPVRLSAGQRAAWAEVFADYEILQPFRQLGRPVHALSRTDQDRTVLPGFDGATVPTGALLGLTRRGWERGAPQDNGIEHWVSRPVPGGYVVLNITPGIAVGYVDLLPEQTIEQVWIGGWPGWAWPAAQTPPDDHRFGDLDPVTLSEILTDLIELTGRTGPATSPATGPATGPEAGPATGPEAGPEAGPNSSPSAGTDVTTEATTEASTT